MTQKSLFLHGCLTSVQYMTETYSLALSTETGRLDVFHLKRIWSCAIAELNGVTLTREGESHLDGLLIDALGLGLQQTMKYLYNQGPTFSEFEEWVVATAGTPDKSLIARLNADISGSPYAEQTRKWLDSVEDEAPVLSNDDLGFWVENGYVVLKNAVEEGARKAAEKAVWDHVGADPDNQESWYSADRDGIMVELIQHEALDANRQSSRIHKAFAQLWKTPDLWVTTDRCGFHVPEREGIMFPGPDLHWDFDLKRPCPFRTQGILYLNDTPPEQGALTVVPEFHKRLERWLASLEPGSDPYEQDLHALGSVPVAGNGGDLIIWHQALPHGSRPNRGKYPRIVQYINMYPGRQNELF